MHSKLRLIPCKSPEDVHNLLLRLVEESSAGDVAGLVTIVVYKGQAYEAHVAGECITNPTFARGAVATLDDYLSELVHDDS